MRTALVLGGADGGLWEAEAALDMGEFAGVVACNDVGMVWQGKLDGWVSLHADKLVMWMNQRGRYGLPPAKRVAGHLGHGTSSPVPEISEYVDHAFPGQKRSGSSGLFAVKYALIDLGFDRAVCCGIPMTAEQAHFFNKALWNGARSHQPGWLAKTPEKGNPLIPLPAIKDRVRSMSGWTMELLGTPTPGWIAGRQMPKRRNGADAPQQRADARKD